VSICCLFIEEMWTCEAFALAFLDKQLFVLKSQQPQLDVYDAISSKPRGTVMIPTNARCCTDMIACSFHHCLYVVNAKCSIVRLEMPSKHMEWKVEDLYSNAVISLTSSHHVLVMCVGGGSHKLKLFSTYGMLLKTTELHPDLVNVTCAVELKPGQYVVTHGRRCDALHRVCVVSSDGKILQTFGGFRGSHPDLLDSPSGVVVDKDGFVYVDDEKNDRLVVLTQDLNYLHCMPGVFTKFSGTRRVNMDKERGHIYVTPWVHYVTHFPDMKHRHKTTVTIFKI